MLHAPEDAWFVDGFLLAALGLPEDQVLVSSKFEPGAPIVHELEGGSPRSVTVVVVSPAFLASPWAPLASQMAAGKHPEASEAPEASDVPETSEASEAPGDGRASLIPVILADCELPPPLAALSSLDFRRGDRKDWEAGAAKLRERLAAPAPKEEEDEAVPCPYPGIRPFSAEDAARFHGRDKDVADLLGLLRDGQRELYIIGPSGSGKSSLVAAGLIPRLPSLAEPVEARPGRTNRSRGAPRGPFLVRQLQPGADPMAALAGALEATAAERSAGAQWPGEAVGRLLAAHADHQLLIFVDQLEELFTMAARGARAAFIAALRVLRGNARVSLVFALCADQFAALMESTLWPDLDGQPRLELPPLRGAELRAVIEAPAQALGVHFEPALLERLLGDVADEPSALPLLQDTLQELWRHRTRRLLRLADYDAMGEAGRSGLAVTTARRADAAVAELSPARQDLARRVLLRLVQLGDGSATTRCRQARAALATAGDVPEEIDAVIRHLSDRRLITIVGDAADGAAHVELAHEVLLSCWPTLLEWITARKLEMSHRRRLEDRAIEWTKRGGRRVPLLNAEEMREIRGWLGDGKARELGLNRDALGYLAQSEAALAEAAAEAKAHSKRRRRLVAATLVVLTGGVIATSVLAVMATQDSRAASEQARLVDEQVQGARQQATASDAQAHKAQREAAAADEQAKKTRQALARLYLSQGHAMLVADQPTRAVPYLLAAREAGSESASLRALFRWAARSVPLLQFTHARAIQAVAWSPDGTRAATASRDGTARIWDATSGQAATPPLAHGKPVTAVAWSPDGKQVATASEDATARIWDASTGQAVTPPLAHPKPVTAVAWSPDGKRLATASVDRTARIWDASTGRATATAITHQGEITAVAWSPDGKRLATASADRSARVWDAATGRAAGPTITHPRELTAVAWSPDGKRLATASADQTARVWDATTGRATTPPLTHKGSVTKLAWSADGARLATASDDQTARVWDTVSGRPMTPPLAHHGIISAVAFRPDGQQVATASKDRTARIWDAATGRAVMPPFVHANEVVAVAWSPDGNRLVTGSEGGTAPVWAADDPGAPPPLTHQGSVHAAAWSADGTRVATAGDDGARVWDVASGKPVIPEDAPLGALRSVRALALSPDGGWLATGSSDGAAQVWDAISGQSVVLPLAHGAAIHALSWSPDGKRLATAGKGGAARVWDVSTGQSMTPPLAHQRDVDAVAWSPDGKRLVTASADGTARIWDPASGKAVGPPLAHKGPVRAMAWSPDGKQLATASADKTARVWDPASGEAVGAPLVHQGAVNAIAWSPDGKRLVTASADGDARVWDPTSGRLVIPALAHPKAVEAVAWSPDGTQLATACADGAARVWDALGGYELTSPFEHGGDVASVAWSPDGSRLVTASGDRIARVWNVSADAGTLDDWRVIAERCDYRLDGDGAIVARDPADPAK